MENIFQYSFAAIFTLFIIFIISIALRVVMKKSQTTEPATKLPPGPWRLPLIGNLHQLIGALPHRRLRDLAKKYGPLMYLQIGEVPHVLVSSPEMAKEIMKTHDLNFAQRPRMLIAGKYYGLDIVFGYGDYWRMMKKFCSEELLSPKRVRSFQSIREEEVSNLIEDIGSNLGFPINLSAKIFCMTNIIASRVAFGMKCKDEEAFISSVYLALKLAGGYTCIDVFPSRKWLHWIGNIRAKFEKAVETADRILDSIIVEHKADMKASKATKGTTSCLLDILLNLLENGNVAVPLEIQNIKAVILELFVGGSLNVATVIEWAMLEMMKNPRVMEKAQAEVRQVFGKQGNVDETRIHELKFLKMVIKETLRLHPPASLIIPRESRESCTINGYYIPAKTRIIINLWAIGRDPRFWEDSERFSPERFVDSSIHFKGDNFEFIPFGAGRRMCPGTSFAMAGVELPLAQLLFHFDWKLAGDSGHTNLDTTESFGLTLRIKEELRLIPVPYNPKPIG